MAKLMSVASWLIAVLISMMSGAAQAQSYPCLPSYFAPKNERIAQLGAENARQIAQTLAERYRATFDIDVLTDIRANYTIHRSDYGFGVRNDAPNITFKTNFVGGRTKYETVVTHGLWPTNFADLILELARELDAVEFETITPTCRGRFDSLRRTWDRTHHTYFLLRDGTIAHLAFMNDTLDERRGLETGGKVEKEIKRRLKTASGLTAKATLVGLPILPEPNTNGGLPDERSNPRWNKIIRAYAELYGMSEDDAVNLNNYWKQYRKGRQKIWRQCYRTEAQVEIPYDRYAWAQCLGAPVELYNITELTGRIRVRPQELAARQSYFKHWAEAYRLAFGAVNAVAVAEQDARWAARQRQWAADERRARAQRRAGGDAILSGVFAGLGSAAQSMAADNQRAANAANDRYRTMYGCAPGECRSQIDTSRSGRTGTGQSGSTATRVASGQSREAQGDNRPRVEKVYRESANTMFKNKALSGEPLRSDAEMCSTIGNLSELWQGPIVRKSSCNCSNFNYQRICTVEYTYMGIDDAKPNGPGVVR